jgi:hypothetical protein
MLSQLHALSVGPYSPDSYFGYNSFSAAGAAAQERA